VEPQGPGTASWRGLASPLPLRERVRVRVEHRPENRHKLVRTPKLHRLPPRMTSRARQLRHESTQPEHRLWQLLRSRQLSDRKLRRQHVVGPFVADFYCPRARLAVEVDGRSHEDQDADCRRTAYFESVGIAVLRVHNDQVLREPQVVLEAILGAVEERMKGAPLSVRSTYED
jgi:very-short-patch-repair endonuclease